MSDMKNHGPTLEDFVNGTALRPLSDSGPANPASEGAYRRGYHQAIAEVLLILESGGTLNPESLSQWVEVDGMKWRKDMTLDRIIIPPLVPAT